MSDTTAEQRIRAASREVSRWRYVVDRIETTVASDLREIEEHLNNQNFGLAKDAVDRLRDDLYVDHGPTVSVERRDRIMEEWERMYPESDTP